MFVYIDTHRSPRPVISLSAVPTMSYPLSIKYGVCSAHAH